MILAGLKDQKELPVLPPPPEHAAGETAPRRAPPHGAPAAGHRPQRVLAS